MRIGIATHEGRVSPVLDVAQRLLVLEVDGGAGPARHEVALVGKTLAGRVHDIQAAAVDVLICGAVSCPLEAALAAAGVQVVPQVCGDVDDVLDAYLAGRLTSSAFLMPGCCGRRRHRAGRGGRGRFGARAGEA